MKNLKKLIDPNLDPIEIDQYMSQILREKFDSELALKYKAKLSNSYNVERTQQPGTNYTYIFLISALILLGGYLILKQMNTSALPNTDEYKLMALNFDEKNPFQANAVTRSSDGKEDALKLQAYVAFEDEKYKEASKALSSIVEKGKKDNFLLGYANFKMGEFAEARKSFSVVLSLGGDDTYISEARFYNVLSLFAEGRTSEAKIAMDALIAGSWESKQLVEIFKN